MSRRLIPLLLALFLLLPTLAQAGRPTMPTLTEKQTEKLQDGKLVLIAESEGEGKAMVTGLLEIEADRAEIWSIVLSNVHVVASSRATKEAVTYHDLTTDGVRDLRIAFMMKVGFSEIRFHSHRTHYIADDYMSWHLDANKENDIEATVGSYSLWPASTPSRTLFLYKARIDTGMKVPEWLEGELTESSLKKFLLYVQEVAEED